jgi:hypothetical protein
MNRVLIFFHLIAAAASNECDPHFPIFMYIKHALRISTGK